MKKILLLLISCASLLAVAQSANSERSPASAPSSAEVFGVFEGKSPCQGIVTLLNVPCKEACTKIKWRLTLYQDPVTHAPTTFALEGLLWRDPPRTGKWTMVKGSKIDPAAIVYQLDPEAPGGFLSFLKGDDNVLFFLDKNRDLLVGNIKHSYTLNRVRKDIVGNKN